jgi:uncharacterized repeat protein (TIGR01451 family)
MSRKSWGLAACVAGLLLLLGASLPGGAPATAWSESPGLDGEDQAIFLIYLATQADLSPAYYIRDWEARGLFVLNALRETAQRTQPAVRQALDGLRAAGHVSDVQTYYIANLIVVRGDAQAARAVARLPGVAGVYPSRPIEWSRPLVAGTGGNGPQAVEWNVAQIGADQVWSTYGVAGASVVVANIDSGVQYDHPALVTQYRGNLGGNVFAHDYNWWDPSNQYDYPWPISGVYPLNSGHGTRTMGVVVGDDSVGNQIGVAPGARWIAAYGFCGWQCLLSATEWMLAPWQVDDFDPGHPTADPSRRPHVVSNSWGVPGGWQLFEPILEAWRAAGIFPAFAAANNGPLCGTMLSPADDPLALSVGATDWNDEIAFFSSRGPVSRQPWLDRYGLGPDVSAPGMGIRSSTPGGGYQSGLAGTSYATPHVAGAVALLWSAEPDLAGRVTETEALLRGTALPRLTTEMCGGVPGSQVPNNTYGWGRLDTLAAVQMAWQAGTLAGTITAAASGTPLAEAQILMQRDGHTVLTTPDPTGDYAFPLGQGTYTVTVEAYGHQPWTAAGIALSQDTTTTLDVTLTPLVTHTLCGVVQEASGTASAGVPLAGGDPVTARLGVWQTPIQASTDPATGFYSATLAANDYQLRAIACGYLAEERTIIVDGDLVEDFALAPRWTYYVRDSRSPCGPTFDWVDATDGTPHTVGFQTFFLLDALDLPPFPFYGNDETQFYVSVNGMISFDQGYPRGEQDVPQLVIPFEGPPNDAIYGFLDVFDPAYGAQGTIYHQVVAGRYLVIEFHQVEHWPSGDPETFEIILDAETGIVKVQYLAVSRPDWATVGVENADGTDAALYAYHNSAGITNSLAVEFYPIFGPPPADQDAAGVTGTLSGTVYLSGTAIPVPGAVVTASTFLRTLTTVADGGGRYIFDDKCADLYTLQAHAVGYSASEPTSARLRWPGDIVETDLFLAPLLAAPTLTKTVNTTCATPGDRITYTLAYANNGDEALQGVVLSDTLPSMVMYVTSTPPALHRDGTLTWTVDIPAGGSSAVTATGLLTAVGPGTTVTNTAYLRWGELVLSSTIAFPVCPPTAHFVYLPVVLRQQSPSK